MKLDQIYHDSTNPPISEQNQQDLPPQQIYQTKYNEALARFKSPGEFKEMVIKCIESVRIVLFSVDITEVIPEHLLDLVVLADVWDSIFLFPARRSYQLLNKRGLLIDSTAKEAPKQIRDIFGCVIREGYLRSNGPAFVRDKATEIEREVVKSVMGELLHHVNMDRQCTTAEFKVDMFGDCSHIAVSDGRASVVYAHTPFIEDHGVNDHIVDLVTDDFSAHFSQWMPMLDAIAASRFAADRRDAFIWLHAPSSWGKGMLTAAMADLGIVTEISVKEIEAAIEGKAVGASPADFVRSWVLLVDEFKTIRSEIKQLNHTLQLSPKYQLRSRVPVFTKLFTSAEDVAALTGSEGVEAQFANRFSYLNPGVRAGRLDDREVFKQVGRETYRKALSTMIARRFNEYVQEMRRVGPVTASNTSDKALAEFNRKHRLTRYFDSLDSTVEEHAHDLKQLLKEFGIWRLKGGSPFISEPDNFRHLPKPLKEKLEANALIVEMSGGTAILLRRSRAFVDSWLTDRVNRGEIKKVAHKINQLMDLVDCRGSVGTSKRYTAVTPGCTGYKPSVGKGIAVILREEISFM